MKTRKLFWHPGLHCEGWTRRGREKAVDSGDKQEERLGDRGSASVFGELLPEHPLHHGRSSKLHWPGSDTIGSRGGPACPSCCPTSACLSADPSSCLTESSRMTWCAAATSAGERGGLAQDTAKGLGSGPGYHFQLWGGQIGSDQPNSWHMNWVPSL